MSEKDEKKLRNKRTRSESQTQTEKERERKKERKKERKNQSPRGIWSAVLLPRFIQFLG